MWPTTRYVSTSTHYYTFCDCTIRPVSLSARNLCTSNPLPYFFLCPSQYILLMLCSHSYYSISSSFVLFFLSLLFSSSFFTLHPSTQVVVVEGEMWSEAFSVRIGWKSCTIQQGAPGWSISHWCVTVEERKMADKATSNKWQWWKSSSDMSFPYLLPLTLRFSVTSPAQDESFTSSSIKPRHWLRPLTLMQSLKHLAG